MSGIQTAVGAAIPTAFTSGLTTQPIWDMLVRNRILPTIEDARNNSTELLNMLYTSKQHVAGKFIIKTARSGRNYAGISAMHKGANMPDPGRQGAYQYNTATRDIYLRIKLDNALLRAAESVGMDTIADPLEYEVKGIVEDLAIKQEIMMHGDGSGRRAEIGVATTSAAGIVTVRHNQDNEGIANCPTAPTIWLDVGMRIAFVSATGTVRVAGAQQAFYIISIPTSTTIVVSATLGGTAFDFNATPLAGNAAGDWIVDATRDASMSALSGVPLDTGWRQEPMGLEGIFRDIGVLDGTGISTAGQQTGAYNYTVAAATDQAAGFQGIQVNGSALSAAYPPPQFNKAIILDAAGGAARQITELLLQQGDSLAKKQNNANIKTRVISYELYDSFIATLLGDKRYNSPGAVAGGATPEGGVPMNGIGFKRSRYMLGGRVVNLDTDQVHIFENSPLRPATAPGGPTWQQANDQDAVYQAMLTSYQVFADVRDRCGNMIVDLQ